MAQRGREKQLYVLTACPFLGYSVNVRKFSSVNSYAFFPLPFFLCKFSFHNVYFLVVICTISSIICNSLET